jgi:hypothetical protein
VFAEVEKTLTNTAPTIYEIINITIKGRHGESSASAIAVQFYMIIKPIRVVIDEIVILPKMMKIFPIPESNVNLAVCFKMSTNAFNADEQKFSDVSAIYM